MIKLPESNKSGGTKRIKANALLLKNIIQCSNRFPDKVALECEGVNITYSDLIKYSTKISAFLLHNKYSAETRVGIHISRSVQLVISMIGVMGAGAAFVYLDKGFKIDQTINFIRESGVAFVITDDIFFKALLHSHKIQAITYKEAILLSMAEGFKDPDPESLAYAIFTSGSSGTPKCVGITHRTLNEHMHYFIKEFQYSSKDTVLQFSSFNFDGSIEQLFPSLCVGAKVVMRGDKHWSYTDLNHKIRAEQITVADIPTSYWTCWINHINSNFPSLRRVTVGGEILTASAVSNWLNGKLSHVRLDNRYGPTEATISICYHKISKLDVDLRFIPIGKVYKPCFYKILNQVGEEVPQGEKGELCLGQECLARGYLNNPGLTAAKFFPNKWSNSGERLYRTGDECSQDSFGQITLYGRLDSNVKIRGNFVNLGEIDALLVEKCHAQQAVTIIQSYSDEDIIVSYVVTNHKLKEIWASARNTFNPQMLPTKISIVSMIPLNSSGKLDKRALGELAAQDDNISAVQEVMNRWETQICEIWCKVLHKDDVGLHDNFFELGGNSLAAIDIMSRASVLFPHRELPVALLFENQTVATFTASLMRKEHDPYKINQIKSGSSEVMVACIPGLMVNPRCYLPLAERVNLDVSFVGFNCYSLSRKLDLSTSVEEIAFNYSRKLLRQFSGRTWVVLGWSSGGLLAYETARQISAQASVKSVATVDACHFSEDTYVDYLFKKMNWSSKVLENGSNDVDMGLALLDLERVISKSPMKKDWLNLRSRISSRSYLAVAYFAKQIGFDNLFEGAGIGSAEFELWSTLDNIDIFRRYEIIKSDLSVNAWAADSSHSVLPLIDWRIHTTGQVDINIVKNSNHHDIIHKRELADYLSKSIG